MNLLKSGPTKIAFGFGLGVMTAQILKELVPVFRELRRPLLKAALQSGDILARNGRAKFAEFKEMLEDVRAEIESEAAAPSPQAPFADASGMHEKSSSGIM